VRVAALEILVHGSRDDLPRHAEAILQPATLSWPATLARQRLPIPVDLRLVLAVDGQRDRLRERELGPAVETDVRLAGQGELDRQHVAAARARVVGGGAD